MAPQDYLRPSQPNIWIDSLAHDPDLLQYICKKIGSDRIVMGSDYPFPLGEMPVPGKMLTSDEQVHAFLTPRDRAQMLAGNAIEFLGLGDMFAQKSKSASAQWIHISN